MPKNRKGRARKSRGAITVRTPFEAMSKAMSVSDSSVLHGKVILTGTTSGTANTPTVVVNLAPGGLGTRASNLGTVFTRFKIRKLVVNFFAPPEALSTAGLTSVGILDDISGEGDQPTSTDGVIELRSSSHNFTNQTTPSYFEYTPLDKKKWYYCAPGVGGSDERLAYQAAMFVSSTLTSQPYTIVVDYAIVFAGAGQ
jgi:hypothetical protein